MGGVGPQGIQIPFYCPSRTESRTLSVIFLSVSMASSMFLLVRAAHFGIRVQIAISVASGLPRCFFEALSLIWALDPS